MLDTTDVRVGNWVLKITGTDKATRAFYEYRAIAVDEYFYTFAKACFPIKITPDILGACGFRHEFGDWYKNLDVEGLDDGLPFLRYKLKDHSWYLKDMKLPSQPVYLHQLQNLYYALTREELDVQLDHFQNTNTVGPIAFFVNARSPVPAE